MVKNMLASAGDMGSIPVSERFPGGVTLGPTRSKIFTIWPFTENVCRPQPVVQLCKLLSLLYPPIFIDLNPQIYWLHGISYPMVVDIGHFQHPYYRQSCSESVVISLAEC